MSDIGAGGVLFAVVMVVVLVALVLVLASGVRRTPAEQIPPVEDEPPATAWDLLPPEALTIEQRLAAIDELHASGRITDDERDEARVRVISTP